MMTRASNAILLATLLVLGPGSAWAQNDTPPWIDDLVQDGMAVTIVVAIVDTGAPDFSDEYTLERSGAGTVTILDEYRFAHDEAIESADRCAGGANDTFFCADPENEDVCEDCDGDGELECWVEFGFCETVEYVHVTETCAEPGEWEYKLTARGWPDFESTDSINVGDEGECTEGDCVLLGEEETCPAVTEDDGCAAAGQPGRTHPVMFCLFLLFLGGTFGLMRRRLR